VAWKPYSKPLFTKSARGASDELWCLVQKDDRLAFITCLKSNRNIYGAITAIIEEGGQTKYEYETWFDNR
jgi:hypothetical protein